MAYTEEDYLRRWDALRLALSRIDRINMFMIDKGPWVPTLDQLVDDAKRFDKFLREGK